MTESGVIHLVIDEKGAIVLGACDLAQKLPDGFFRRVASDLNLTDDDKKWLASAWQRWHKDIK